jgi:hypothetical protein
MLIKSFERELTEVVMIQALENNVAEQVELKPKSGKKHHYAQAMKSGFEGREEELGKAMSVVFKTMQNTTPYVHEINDALVKAWLVTIQYAKNRGEFDELVAHDIETMEPINRRLKKVIENAGDKEIALIGIFDHTACHYQLVLETESEPGKRTWKSPFKNVLEACKKIGQFDLTEQEIHERWTVPRLMGYADALGVKFKVSPWSEDGVLTCELVD